MPPTPVQEQRALTLPASATCAATLARPPRREAGGKPRLPSVWPPHSWDRRRTRRPRTEPASIDRSSRTL
eukprot:5322103-Pyramimonas_sp.AAC.1